MALRSAQRSRATKSMSPKEVARAYPGLIDAASLIGGIQIQSRGEHRRQPVERITKRRTA